MISHFLQSLYALLIFFVLAITVITLIISFITRNHERSIAVNCLIVLATLLPILVIGANFFPKPESKEVQAAKLAQQLESLSYGVKQTSDIKIAQQEIPLVGWLSHYDFILHVPDQLFEEDEKWLSEQLEKHADSGEQIAVRIALLRAEEGTDPCPSLKHQDSPLCMALRTILCPENKSAKLTLDGCLQQIDGSLPHGWFQDAAVLAAYKHFGESAKVNELLTERKSRAVAFGYKLLASIAISLSLISVGLVVLIRSVPKLASTIRAPWQVNWGLKKIWCVCLCALYAQALVGLVAVGAFHISSSSPSADIMIGDFVAVAASTLAVLIATYQLILKPGNLSFTEGLLFRSQNSSFGGSITRGFLAFCCAMPLIQSAHFIQQHLTNHTQTENSVALHMVAVSSNATVSTMAAMFLMASVLAPIAEEILFRGLLYPYLRTKLPMWPAALISGALFALVHWDIPMLAQLTIMGTVQAITVERSRSLLPAIVMHGLWNGSMVLRLLLLR